MNTRKRIIENLTGRSTGVNAWCAISGIETAEGFRVLNNMIREGDVSREVILLNPNRETKAELFRLAPRMEIDLTRNL